MLIFLCIETRSHIKSYIECKMLENRCCNNFRSTLHIMIMPANVRNCLLRSKTKVKVKVEVTAMFTCA